MERAYLLIAAVLTGAAVGMLTGRLAMWVCVGALMGVVLALAARRRPEPEANEVAGRRPIADRRF